MRGNWLATVCLTCSPVNECIDSHGHGERVIMHLGRENLFRWRALQRLNDSTVRAIEKKRSGFAGYHPITIHIDFQWPVFLLINRISRSDYIKRKGFLRKQRGHLGNLWWWLRWTIGYWIWAGAEILHYIGMVEGPSMFGFFFLFE